MKGRFHLPYVNGKFIVPFIVLLTFSLIFYFNPNFLSEQFNISGENAAKNIPMIVFLVICIVMAVLSFVKNLSLIPVLGLLSCCYLLTGMEASNWTWFSAWLGIGLVVYLFYGYRKSNLNLN